MEPPNLPPANVWEGNPLKDAFIRLGLTDVAAREFMENGITSSHQLRMLTEATLTRLIKQIHRDNAGGAGLAIPFMSQQYIQAMRFWAQRQHTLGMPYDVETFQLADAEYWLEKMQENEEAGEAAGDLIKPPEIFKKIEEWLTWSEQFLTYTRTKKGKNNGTPIAYVIREHNIPTPDMTFPTETDEKIGRALLIGPLYNADNADMYDLLKSLSGNGPLWPFIQPFERRRDGRGAWKALIQYFEGDTMKARLKAAAYQAITKANYQGPRRNFEFSTYVTIHQRAHQDLARYEEPVPELKKVRDILEGITDPRCESIKLQILSNPTYNNNFMETVNFVAGALDLLNENHNALTRRISEVSTARGGGRSNNHNNRGGRQGRGGRGRSLARSYSPEEWQSLSAEERARIYRARDNQSQNQGGQGQGGRGRGGGRGRNNYFRGRGRGRGSDDSTRQTSAVHTDGGGGGDNNDTYQVSDDVSEITRHTGAATNRIDLIMA